MSQRDLERELQAMEQIQGRLRELLIGVAEALKGPQDPRQPHDWSDLPELARRLSVEHKHLKSWWQQHLDGAVSSFDQMSVDLSAARREASAEGFLKGVEFVRQAIKQRAPQIEGAFETMVLPSPSIAPDEVI